MKVVVVVVGRLREVLPNKAEEKRRKVSKKKKKKKKIAKIVAYWIESKDNLVPQLLGLENYPPGNRTSFVPILTSRKLGDKS